LSEDKIMLQSCKPDSVTFRKKPSIIYLARQSPDGSSCLPLPPKLLRATEEVISDLPEYIWHFNSQGLPPKHITVFQRALLPHDFTLISSEDETVYFLRYYSVLLRNCRKKPTR